MFAYDSITVLSAWELTSVSMRYSQGDGVNTSLSRLMYCTHELYSFLDVSIRDSSCVVCMLSSVTRHVLPGTQVIKIIRVNQLYQQG